MSVASHMVISKYVERTGEAPSGLFFNKMMSLLHSRMLERRVNFPLPHCWYRWGDEVVRYEMPREISWNHEEPPYTTVSWDGDLPYYASLDEDRETLERVVVDLLDMYSDDGGVEKAVEAVYTRAPFEFQRRYRECRNLILDRSRTPAGVRDFGRNMLLPALESAMKVFPEADFPVVSRKVPAFRSVMRLILEEEEVDVRLVREVSEEFWFWFCYHLRLHPDAHENVSEETLEHWRDRLGTEERRYHRMLGDHILRLARDHPSVMDDDVLGPMFIERSKQAEEEDAIIDEAASELEGLEDFLRDIHGGQGTG